MGTSSLTVFPHVARTANASSATVNARGASAVTFDINLTAFTGTSITFNVEYYESNAAAWYSLLVGTALTAAGRQRLSVGVDIATVANVGVNAVAPPLMRVTTTGTWNPATFNAVAQRHA